MAQDNKRYTSPFFRLFRESSLAMAVINKNGFILASNECFDTLFRTFLPSSPGIEAPGPSNFSFLRETPRFSNFLSRLVSGASKSVVFEAPFKSVKGSIHWLKIRAWVVQKIENIDPKQQGPFIGLIVEDQTKERQEERQLQEDKAVAQRGMEAKSQFLANMSHEIRTPIQTIIGMTELLQDTKLDREQAEYSRQVKFSAEVLLSLINDILDYSKIEAGKMELEHTDFDLEQTIEQAVEMISLEAHKKGLEMIVKVPPNLALIIKGDPNKFRQIVINLVKNAVKFTREGGVTISAELTQYEGHEAVRVSIIDTGIGIAPEMQKKLFSTFFQGDPSNTRRFGGTGLGLAISRNLVELMGGKIEMFPNPKGGSIFRFTIPIERSDELPRKLELPDHAEDHILVVDDYPEAAALISSYLNDIGFANVDSAPSGEEALAAMRAAAYGGNSYTICLIDMIMPQMDGWRLAAEINNDKLINETRLILMVPHGLLGADAKMTLLKWFNAYINKPIKRRDLAETINAAEADPVEELDAADEIPEGENDEAEVISDDIYRNPVMQERLPILIVEDHPVNQKLFSMIMEKLGFPAILADDGIDALEKAAANPVSLIFMDIQMPRMNGYEATERLRERGFTQPIIAVTASALSDERERCLKAGIDDILVKPFKRPDIEKMLLKWIDKKSSYRHTGQSSPEKNGPPSSSVSAAVSSEKKQGPPAKLVFDKADLLETFFDNEETLKPLITQFLRRTAEQLKSLPRNLAEKNWEEGRRNAHTIKGSSLTLSGKDLGAAAARVELAFKEKNVKAIQAGIPELAAAFKRFKAAAEEYAGS
ncbi:response regulator [Treponema sp. OttesenSCG-928-L16]|nr:response regulator [Treponema sp. OttesenSCG-928-L16]